MALRLAWLLAGIGLSFAPAILACSDGEAPTVLVTGSETPAPSASASPTPAPTFTPTPRVPEGLYELTVRTGVRAADAFLSRLLSRDFEAISSNAQFTLIACGDIEAGVIQPRPLCEPDEPEGSPVEGLLLGRCQPGFIRPVQRDRIAESLALLIDLEPYVESVWQVKLEPGGFTQHLRDGFALVLVSGRGQHQKAWIIYLDEDGNLAGRTTCGDYRLPQGDGVKLFPS